MALPCTEECGDMAFLKKMDRVGQMQLQKMYKIYFRLDRPESSRGRQGLAEDKVANEARNFILKDIVQPPSQIFFRHT
jgi:hypothetical protein